MASLSASGMPGPSSTTSMSAASGDAARSRTTARVPHFTPFSTRLVTARLISSERTVASKWPGPSYAHGVADVGELVAEGLEQAGEIDERAALGRLPVPQIGERGMDHGRTSGRGRAASALAWSRPR